MEEKIKRLIETLWHDTPYEIEKLRGNTFVKHDGYKYLVFPLEDGTIGISGMFSIVVRFEEIEIDGETKFVLKG